MRLLRINLPKGGYILEEASAAPQVVLFATGSEVAIANSARQALEADGDCQQSCVSAVLRSSHAAR